MKSDLERENSKIEIIIQNLTTEYSKTLSQLTLTLLLVIFTEYLYYTAFSLLVLNE